MEVLYSDNFLKSAARLPEKLRQKLSQLVELVRENPFHPQLHTKHLTGELAGSLAFRITRDWRVKFRFVDPRTVQLLRVANRKDIYR